jgi:chromate transporter
MVIIIFIKLLDIFLAFFRASILSYGGGPASIPLMRSEVVERYKWFTNEQFGDALAIGNTLPGPIAPKMAAYIGYNVGGVPGAVTGVTATVVPTALAIILLANILLTYKDTRRMKSMLMIAKPIVVVLLLQSAIELMTKQNYSNIVMYVVSAAVFALVIFIKVNPAIVVVCGLALGLLFPDLIMLGSKA